eukprot:Gb_13874 [translate_table: standard]
MDGKPLRRSFGGLWSRKRLWRKSYGVKMMLKSLLPQSLPGKTLIEGVHMRPKTYVMMDTEAIIWLVATVKSSRRLSSSWPTMVYLIPNNPTLKPISSELEREWEKAHTTFECTSCITLLYLDTKRNAFPRFFFISDDELLSVLGSSDPSSIQEHMLKLFDNCAALQFGERQKTVVGMRSSEGETYAFRAIVPTEGAVEVWMKRVESEMRRSLYQISKEGIYYYAKSRRMDWILNNLGMVTLVRAIL